MKVQIGTSEHQMSATAHLEKNSNSEYMLRLLPRPLEP